MSLLAISDTHKREKANLLATNSPTFGSHSSANGPVPHASHVEVQQPHDEFIITTNDLISNNLLYKVYLQIFLATEPYYSKDMQSLLAEK